MPHLISIKFDLKLKFLKRISIFFTTRSPCFSHPSAIYFGRGVAKVNGVEKCVLKARPPRERERKKQGGVCGKDSSTIHHGCFISDVAIRHSL